MNKKLLLFISVFFTTIFAENIFSQEIQKTQENENSEIDSIFFDSEDITQTEDSENTAQKTEDFDYIFEEAEDSVQKETNKEQNQEPVTQKKEKPPLSFFGTFSTEAVYLEKIYERENSDDRKMGALLTYDFGVSFRPSPVLAFKSIVSFNFPSMEISLDSLYFDYIMFDKFYLTAGKTSTSWGNSVIFDTNILDDIVTNGKTSPTGIAILTIPFGPGSFEGIVNYWGDAKEFSKNDLSFNASIEYPFLGFSYKLFAAKWANNAAKTAPNAGKGAFGFEITGDIKDFHLTSYGSIHPAPDDWTSLYYANFIAGISTYKNEPQKHGAICEYQLVYQNNENVTHSFNNQIALTAMWSRIFDSKFSPVISTKYDINNSAFSIVPSISVSDFMPYAKIYFSVPMIYGNMTVEFGDDNNNKFSLHGVKDKFSIWAGFFIKITVSY